MDTFHRYASNNAFLLACYIEINAILCHVVMITIFNIYMFV